MTFAVGPGSALISGGALVAALAHGLWLPALLLQTICARQIAVGLRRKNGKPGMECVTIPDSDQPLSDDLHHQVAKPLDCGFQRVATDNRTNA